MPVESSDRRSVTSSGAAAARQAEQPSSPPETQSTPTDERDVRLARLREQYQNGSYQVEAADLSSAIVDAHLKP